MKRASRTRDQKHRRYYKPLERVAINEIEKYSNQFLPDTVLKNSQRYKPLETASMMGYQRHQNRYKAMLISPLWSAASWTQS